MKKSQSSTEFMVFIGMAILILMSYFAISHYYLNLTYKQKDIISGQDLAKQIKNEINLASRVEDNYHRTFDLPLKVGDKDFSVVLSGREVTVTIDGIDYVELLSINVIEKSFSSGDNIEINKINDNIYFGALMCNEGETKCGTLEECEGVPLCVMKCNNNQWIKLEDCNDRCEEGECKIGVCDEGETRCGNPLECNPYPEYDQCILLCDANNQWTFGYSCTEPDTCEGGECICEAGTKKCGTEQECQIEYGMPECVFICTSFNYWEAHLLCSPNGCSNGECIVGGA